MKMRGSCRQHGAINPKGGSKGPEYGQQTLAISGKSVPVPAGGSAKSAMVDGPYGGKRKA